MDSSTSLTRTETPKSKPDVKKEVIPPKVQHSFEDIEGLINNLLMLNTFTLGFKHLSSRRSRTRSSWRWTSATSMSSKAPFQG